MSALTMSWSQVYHLYTITTTTMTIISWCPARWYPHAHCRHTGIVWAPHIVRPTSICLVSLRPPMGGLPCSPGLLGQRLLDNCPRAPLPLLVLAQQETPPTGTVFLGQLCSRLSDVCVCVSDRRPFLFLSHTRTMPLCDIQATLYTHTYTKLTLPLPLVSSFPRQCDHW